MTKTELSIDNKGILLIFNYTILYDKYKIGFHYVIL